MFSLQFLLPKFSMNHSRFLTVLGFIIIGVLSRLLPHPPNFTSLNAIALFSVFYFQDRWLVIVTVFSSLFLSDLMIGFHSTMPVVYLSFGLTILLGNSKHLKSIFARSVCASLLFFAVVNFGVWLSGSLYPKTMSGLGLCYLAAIPFLSSQVIGDLVCLAMFMSGYCLIEVLKDDSVCKIEG